MTSKTLMPGLHPAGAALRGRSGSVDSTDPLVSFLYILLRDHLPAGSVEAIMQQHVEAESQQTQFTNGYIASYAKDLATRLQEKS